MHWERSKGRICSIHTLGITVLLWRLRLGPDGHNVAAVMSIPVTQVTLRIALSLCSECVSETVCRSRTKHPSKPHCCCGCRSSRQCKQPLQLKIRHVFMALKALRYVGAGGTWTRLPNQRAD